MVTAATYLKRHHLTSRRRLDAFTELLFQRLSDVGASLHAWAVFSNHYHVVVVPRDPRDIRPVFSHLHSESARALNEVDAQPGRKLWFQFWDTALTYERSYLARLNYVHTNAVHHRLAGSATDYPWCSAAWFLDTAPNSFRQTVGSFKTDRINVMDEFTPIAPG